jgi:hypothetical protein
MARSCLVVGLAAALLAVPPTGDAAHHRRSKCQRLKGRDVAPARNVKLVLHHNDTGGTVKGCMLPRGKVVEVASNSHSDSISSSSFAVHQVAGRHVLVRANSRDRSGYYSQTYVFDIKRDIFYNIASRCTSTYCNDNIPKHLIAVGAAINSDGQAAALVKTDRSDHVGVRGFTSEGRAIRLDGGHAGEIRGSSLRLDGSVVTWTHSGVQKHATLPKR